MNLTTNLTCMKNFKNSENSCVGCRLALVKIVGIWRGWLLPHGLPQALGSDNGREFILMH